MHSPVEKSQVIAVITVPLSFAALTITFIFGLVFIIFCHKKHRFCHRLNSSSLWNGRDLHNSDDIPLSNSSNGAQLTCHNSSLSIGHHVHNNNHSNDNSPSSNHSNGVMLTLQCLNNGSNGVHITPCQKSADAIPYLNLSDIGDIVKISYRIKNGKFGTFYQGYYDGEAVMLKKFEPSDKSSWLRETMLYNQVLHPHNNILVCFASALVTNGSTIPEHWLVTKHHHLGSLQDYLRHHTVAPQVLIKMATSISSGLVHLHSDRSYDHVKTPVAHCNLTSRNLLVKDNLFCCIADFRLAVFKHRNRVNMGLHPTEGTVRYMAPETLSSTLNLDFFESFKCLDVYALGLVLWEICKRTSTNGSKSNMKV